MISVSDILTVLDKIIGLIYQRKEDRQHLRQTLLTQIFDDLLLVHADYIKMFEETLQELRNPEINAADIANRLRQRRLDFEPVRVKLRILSGSLEQIEGDKPVEDFIRSVIAYFPRGESPEIPSPATRILELLDGWDGESGIILPDGEEIKKPRETLVRAVENLLSTHRHSWSYVCEYYAQLKVHAGI